jgi:hypothetical protein
MADEIDAIEFISVDNIVKTLRTSSNSRFPNGKGKAIVISYKRYIGSSGKIEEYYQKYKDKPSVYTKRGATWDFNPSKSRKDFDEYFDTDPESAEIEYGSIETSGLINSWIKDSTRVFNSMNFDREWILDLPIPVIKTPTKDNSRDWLRNPNSEVSFIQNNETFILDPYDIPIKPCDKDTNYIFIGDPAEGSTLNGGDAFGVILGHREFINVDIETDELNYKGEKVIKSTLVPRVVVDFSFRFTGRMFQEKQIQYIAIENLIDKLVRNGYNINMFSFDGFNIIKTCQSLAVKYPDSIIYQRNMVTDEDYAALKASINSECPPSNGLGKKDSGGGIDMPYHPILYWEIESLIIEKGKVAHRTTSSKDMTDPLAKLCNIIMYKYPFYDLLISDGTKQDEAISKEEKLPEKISFNSDYSLSSAFGKFSDTFIKEEHILGSKVKKPEVPIHINPSVLNLYD